MASSWGASWASHWGNSWGTVGAVVAPQPTTGGGAGVVMTPGSLTRKKFREIQAALQAEDDARERAQELKNKSQRKEVLAATSEAEEAIKDARQAQADFELLEDLRKLTEALKSVARARNLTDVMFAADKTREMTRDLQAHLEALEEEEDMAAISMLI